MPIGAICKNSHYTYQECVKLPIFRRSTAGVVRWNSSSIQILCHRFSIIRKRVFFFYFFYKHLCTEMVLSNAYAYSHSWPSQSNLVRLGVFHIATTVTSPFRTDHTVPHVSILSVWFCAIENVSICCVCFLLRREHAHTAARQGKLLPPILKPI